MMAKFFHLGFISPRRSLGARIGIIIAVISIALTLVFSFFAAKRSRDEIQKNIGMDLSELAFQMSDKLDKGMFERYREIQLMAKWPVITDRAASREAKRLVLDGIKKTYQVHAWIGLTNEKGIVVAGTGGLLEGNDVSARPWFPGGSKGPYAGDVHGALLLSKHLPAPPDGNLRFVDVAAPVYDAQGRFMGVLCSHLNWEWAKEVRESLFQETGAKKGVEIFIVNNQGEILLSPAGLPFKELTNLTKAWHQRKSGYAIQDWPDGKGFLTGVAVTSGYLDYPGLGWTIAVRIPSSVAFTPALRLQIWILGFGLTMGLLLAAAGWGVALKITAPLRQIAGTADSIREQGSALSIPVTPGRDEVAVLSRSLHDLISDLNERNYELVHARDKLEDRVKERTSELQDANARLINEIDERKRAEEEVRQAVYSLNEAQKIADMGSFDETFGSGTVWSDGLYRLLELEAGFVTPSRTLLTSHVHSEDRAVVESFLNDIENEGKDLEFRMETSYGQIRYYNINFAVLRSGGDAKGVRGTVMNITEHKKAELLKEDIERIMRHDLKTPLNVIINMPAIMLYDANLTQDQRENLEFIQQAGYRMLDQINESLTIYKMETGAFSLEPKDLNLCDIVRRQAVEAGLSENRRGVNIVLEYEGRPLSEKDSLIIPGDQLLCHSMLGNLIKNAAEASPDGGTVTICLGTRDGCAVLSISNKGVVPSAIRGSFFEKYSTAGKHGGTGIGTYSAKLMVEAHNGTISFETSEEKGTTVFINLPLKQEAYKSDN